MEINAGSEEEVRFKVIGEDWKGFNTACYKKDNQVGLNDGLPEV